MFNTVFYCTEAAKYQRKNIKALTEKRQSTYKEGVIRHTVDFSISKNRGQKTLKDNCKMSIKSNNPAKLLFKNQGRYIFRYVKLQSLLWRDCKCKNYEKYVIEYKKVNAEGSLEYKVQHRALRLTNCIGIFC